MRKKEKNILLLSFFMIISFLGIMLIYIANNHQLPMGQDSVFHMARVLGLNNVFQSPVNFNASGHQGNILNVMYPWQTLYPAYLLYWLTGNLAVAMYIFYYLVTLSTLLIAFYTMNTIKKQYFPSILFALIYTFSSYRLTNLVSRTDIGEYLAMTFLPLVLLGCYKIFCNDYKKYYILSIGMTLLACSHMLSLVMSTVFIAIGTVCYLVLGKNRNQWKARIFALVKAALLTVLLCAAIFVPMICQVRYQQLYFPGKIPFSPSKLQELLMNAVLSKLTTCTVGSTILAGIILVIFCIKKINGFEKLLYFLGVIVFICTSTIIPWSELNNTPISTIQFIFRFNSYITLFIAYPFAAALAYVLRNRKLMTTAGISLLVLIINGSSIIEVYKEQAPPNMMHYTTSEAVRISYSLMHYDYTSNETAANYALLEERPYFENGERVNVTEKFEANKLTFTANFKNTCDVITPILRFEGQVVI